jgi:hypothetical protein
VTLLSLLRLLHASNPIPASDHRFTTPRNKGQEPRLLPQVGCTNPAASVVEFFDMIVIGSARSSLVLT